MHLLDCWMLSIPRIQQQFVVNIQFQVNTTTHFLTRKPVGLMQRCCILSSAQYVDDMLSSSEITQEVSLSWHPHIISMRFQSQKYGEKAGTETFMIREQEELLKKHYEVGKQSTLRKNWQSIKNSTRS